MLLPEGRSGIEDGCLAMRSSFLFSSATFTALLISILVVDLTIATSLATGVVVAAAVAPFAIAGLLVWFIRKRAGRLKSACVVKLDGHLDALVSQAHTAILKEVVKCGYANILINCKRVTFIDSAGLSVLISIVKAVAPRNGVEGVSG